MSKLDKEEQGILNSYESGQWKSVGRGKSDFHRYQRYARSTFQKDRRVNIRISSKDLEGVQKRALEEGIPYQTLISSIMHKYVAGALRYKRA
jgi:predicted DNA binding CopG/RHH family protein